MLALPKNLIHPGSADIHIVTALQAAHRSQSDVTTEQSQPPPSDNTCDSTANLMRLANMSNGMRF